VKVRRQKDLLKTGRVAERNFEQRQFSSIATDAKGVIQIFTSRLKLGAGFTPLPKW